MSMHQGIDLSRFKKISSDGKTTTLRHGKGHEIKIAHGSLSQNMRDHINNMPVHLAEEGLAPDPIEEPQQPKPAGLAPETLAPQPAAPAPQAAPVAPVAPPQAVAQAPAPQQPAQAPQAVAAPIAAPEKTVEQIAQEKNDHDVQVMNDLATGAITPKTAQSLYAEKDTPGKILTLFGLLVGGAASGLTHQPNVVAEMMDKQIQNDLEAQKSTKENARNWLRLNQDHELQKYTQEKMAAETAGQKAETYSSIVGTELNRAKLQQLSKEIPGFEMSVTNEAMKQMRMDRVQNIQSTIDKLPPGPNRDKQQLALNGLKGAVIAKNTAGNLKVAGTAKLGAALKGTSDIENPVDLKKLNSLIHSSRVMGNNGLTPQMTESEYGQALEESKALTSNRRAAKMYSEAFTDLNNQLLGGKLNKQDYEAKTAILTAKIAKETAGHFNLQEAGKQGGAMFPSWQDFGGKNGKTRRDKYGMTMQMFKDNENTPVLGQHPGLVSRFPEFKSPFKEAGASSAKEGEKSKSASGKPIIFKGGKWIYI